MNKILRTVVRCVLPALFSGAVVLACDVSDSESESTTDTGTGSENPGTGTPADTGSDSGNPGTDTPGDTGTGNVNPGTDTPGDTGTGNVNPGTDTPADTGTGNVNPGTDTPADTGTGNVNPGTDTPTDTGTSGNDDTGTGEGDTGDSASIPDTGGDVLGEVHSGGMYHLGPVDFAETEWHNACAPGPGYREALLESTGLGGEYLAGVANAHNMGGGICDACIRIDTAEGKSIVARVVTYGVTSHDENLDVSPSLYEEIHMGEWPRDMSWQLVSCPDTGPLYYEFQTEANIWWTSLWVRNPRVLVDTVEVKSSNHSDYYELRRGGDGTFTDGSGFGDGPFTLRITAIDGQVIIEEFDGFETGELVTSVQQFE